MERIDLIDEHGCLTGGVEERNKIHLLGLRHQASGVIILRSRGETIEILSQQRSYKKEKNAGLWDMSASGHIPSGETPVASLKREVKEELGIDIEEKEMILLGKFWRHEKHREDFIENELDYIYVTFKNVDLKKIKVQQEEVEKVNWISVQDFKKKLADKTAVQRNGVWDALFEYIERKQEKSHDQQN